MQEVEQCLEQLPRVGGSAGIVPDNPGIRPVLGLDDTPLVEGEGVSHRSEHLFAGHAGDGGERPAVRRHARLALALLLGSAPAAAADDGLAPLPGSDERSVLVMLSSHEGDPHTLAVMRGVRRVFDESGSRISPWVESLDSRRNRGRAYFDDLLRVFERKLATARFDLAIAVGNEALEFALEHREAIAPATPLVFADVDRVDATKLATASDVTGIRTSVDFRPTLDAALALDPRADTIVLLTPGLDRRYLIEDLVPHYRPDLALEVWADERLETIVSRLAELPVGTIVVPVGEPRLENGRKLETDEFVRALAPRISAPMYTVWGVALGHGIVGGELVSAEAQGEGLARLALRVLGGESPQAIPIVDSDAASFAFDHEVVRRLALPLDRLPPGAELVNVPESFYRLHRDVLLGSAAIIVVLGGFIGVLLRNIAKRRRAEAELLESEARFRDFLENSPTAICLKDLDGRFVLANPTFEEVMGVKLDALLGRRSAEVFDRCFAAASEEHDAEVVARARAVSREESFDVAGDRRDVLSVKFPVRSPGGESMGVGSITVDVTELKRAERALREREQRFREYAEAELAKARSSLVRQTRLGAIGQMASTLAHDIRNPLGAIRNAAYYLRRRVPEHERKWADYLELIEREVVASDRIISHMMDLVRNRPLERVVVDLGALLDAVERRLEPREEVRLERDLEPEAFEVAVDAAQFERVLDNLISNASQAARSRVLVRARRSEESAMIAVEDDGPGVAEHVVDHLFEPLVTTKAKGTGLGLTICEQIVNQHGGTIDYAPRAGGGASFCIVLPVASALVVVDGVGARADAEHPAL